MLPKAQVRVTAPTSEHQHYLNATGHIVDVRDFHNRFCQVELDSSSAEVIWFDVAELTREQNTKRRTNDEESM